MGRTHGVAFALTNCALIDGSEQDLLPHMTVVVKERVIQTVQPASFPLESTIEVYDCTGLTVLPGLIDMHVHICCPGDNTSDSQDHYWNSAVSMTLNAISNLQKALFAGITTVRDLGGALHVPFEVKREWQNGRIKGARPLIAGRMITATGGHGTEGGMNFGVEVTGYDEIRKAVRTEALLGADLIKLATCSGGTPTELTAGELQAGIEESHWMGYRVAVHAHFQRRSIMNAIQAGCDTLEHGCVLDEDAVALMAAKGIYYCPTLKIVASRVEAFSKDGVNSERGQKARHNAKVHAESMQLAHSNGVHIIGGTDAGWLGIPFDALHDEMHIMSLLGMSNKEVIRAVTGLSADALGRPNQLGYIRPSAIADILVVRGDPLKDLSVLKKPKAVMLNGEIVCGSLETTHSPHVSFDGHLGVS